MIYCIHKTMKMSMLEDGTGLLLHSLLSCTVTVVVTLITAEESARMLLSTQEVLSECSKDDWTVAVAGTSRE